jgi:hypothetical protein
MIALSYSLPQQFRAILTVKTLLMEHYQSMRASDANVKLLLDAPPSTITSAQFKNALRHRMELCNSEDDDELQGDLTLAQVPVSHQIRALKATPLADKPIILASMPIIDVQHAAWFLNLTETAFNHFNAFHRDIFGQCYMNRRHYSLDELTLIKNNPEWLSGHLKSFAPATTLMPNYPQFNPSTVVEYKVAMAFCNTPWEDMPKVAYVTRDSVCTYYLADLDKIRVENLNAYHQ